MVTLPAHQTPVKHGGRWDVAVKAQLGVTSCPKYWLLVVLDEILGHRMPRAIFFSTGFSPKVSAKRPGSTCRQGLHKSDGLAFLGLTGARCCHPQRPTSASELTALHPQKIC